jgi:TatD DNase family protein
VLIDAHCHLDVFVEEGTLDDVCREAEARSVGVLAATGTCEKDWDLYVSLSRSRNGIFTVLGLHPLAATDDWASSLRRLETILENARPRAVGEIGLDFHGHEEHSPEGERQKLIFRAQLELAQSLHLPVVIHCREAFAALKEILTDCAFDYSRVMMHCFSGSLEDARWFHERGAYLSFSGIVSYKNADNLRQSLRLLNLERSVLETDSPFLAPVPFRGRQNRPALLHYTAEEVARILQLPYETVARRTTDNARAFFGLPETDLRRVVDDPFEG